MSISIIWLRVIYNMNLQEQISRIQSMMGLNEITNPYKVDWEYPTQEYFTQELSELLGNPGRFTDQEFFNPDNYDTVYRIMPNTFKMVNKKSISNRRLKSDIQLNVMTSMKLLRMLHNQYQDWGLAFGAYNTGKPCINEYSQNILNKEFFWISGKI